MAEALDAQQWIHTSQLLAALTNPHTKQKVKPYEVNPYTATRAERGISDLTQMWAPPPDEQGEKVHERSIKTHQPPA